MQIIPPDGPRRWVRRNKERFFVSGRPTMAVLAGYIVEDILHSGGQVVAGAFAQSWWVGSNADWFGCDAEEVPALFERIVAAPSQGRNSLRAEVIVAEMADRVMLKYESKAVQIKGSFDPSGEEYADRIPVRFAVAFGLDERMQGPG